MFTLRQAPALASLSVRQAPALTSLSVRQAPALASLSVRQAAGDTLVPSLVLDFAHLAALDPRLTFARASTGTYYDAAGVLRTAASGAARFTYDPITKESLGLLIEEQSTNRCLYSEDLTATGWNTGTTSVTANAIAAPDGTTTADLLTPTAGINSNRFRAVTFSGNGEKGLSVYLKAGSSARTTVLLYDSTAAVGRHYINVTWTAGVPTAATMLGSGSVFSPESAGNGWYRIRFSATGVVAANSHIFGVSPDSLAGTGTVYLWGLQAEDLNVPTSYIPTAASTVTRSADTCVMTGTAFSAWYRADEGTLVAKARPMAGVTIGVSPVVAALVGGDVNELIEVSRSSAPGARNQAEVLIITAGSVQTSMFSFSAGTFVQGQLGRVAFGYRANDCRGAGNGVLSASDTSVTLPTITQLSIGARTAGAARWWNGPVAFVAYYPIRLTDAQLQTVTL